MYFLISKYLYWEVLSFKIARNEKPALFVYTTIKSNHQLSTSVILQTMRTADTVPLIIPIERPETSAVICTEVFGMLVERTRWTGLIIYCVLYHHNLIKVIDMKYRMVYFYISHQNTWVTNIYWELSYSHFLIIFSNGMSQKQSVYHYNI